MAWAPPTADLDRLRSRAWIAGGAGALVTLVGALLDAPQFYRSYLVAWLLWLGIALGCSAVAMLHHLSRGAWGVVIRRVLEAAARTLPALAVLFVPVLLGMPHLYVWTQEAVVEADAALAEKALYLNEPFFIARAGFYFLVWIGFALLLSRLSGRQDASGDPALFRRMQQVAAAGLVLYCLTISFAAFDWLMSIDPHWYSTIFGVYMIGGQGLAAFAFVVAVAFFLSRRPPMDAVYQPRHFHDYGNLMLAFVMLWAYFAVSQYLIIWAGNLPGEIRWFLARRQGPWPWLAAALALFHFGLPFLLLLSRGLKRQMRALAAVALLVLFMRWVDLYWLAVPSFHEPSAFHWLDLATMVAVGGVWLGIFCTELKRRPLLPVNDPYLQEALAHGSDH